MREKTRKRLRLAIPLLTATAFGAQAAIIYAQEGSGSGLYIGGAITALATFDMFWWIEKD